MRNKMIDTSSAPGAVGPYAQGVVAGEMVFCSGQIPIDPETGEMVGGDIGAATDRVIRNLAAVLGAAGLKLSDVVKTTVFLVDLDDFAAMNDAYARHFGEAKPARACVEVARLPKGARVEIDAIACRAPLARR